MSGVDTFHLEFPTNAGFSARLGGS
jgi:hypothetical protein